MFVALFIVVSACFAADLRSSFNCQPPFFVFLRVWGAKNAQLADIERLSHIAAALFGNIFAQTVFDIELFACFLTHEPEGALYSGKGVLGRDAFELKHGAAAEKRGIDVKIGVFGGGGYKSYIAVFNILQKGLLLLFIEVLYLVKIQKQAVWRGNRVYLGYNVLYVV